MLTKADSKLTDVIAEQEAIFVRRQPASARLAARARRHLAGGVTSSWQITEPQPVWLSHGKGSKVYDADGNEYVDLHGGYGAALAGHAHPAIVKAVRDQVGHGTHFAQPDPVNSVLHNPQLHAAVIQTVRLSVLTTVIAVPLGVAFALGINRWRGPLPASFNFVMILSYVIPELIFGVAMFFVFTTLFSAVHLDTAAEVLGLVTWNVSWPAIVVQARLVTLGRQYEEAAADLGANQFQVMRRVLGSIMLVMSLIVVIIGYVGYRLLTRGERGSGLSALTTIAGEG